MCATVVCVAVVRCSVCVAEVCFAVCVAVCVAVRVAVRVAVCVAVRVAVRVALCAAHPLRAQHVSFPCMPMKRFLTHTHKHKHTHAQTHTHTHTQTQFIPFTHTPAGV